MLILYLDILVHKSISLLSPIFANKLLISKVNSIHIVVTLRQP